MTPFRNRREAGRSLARALEPFREEPGLAALALPRGGVPVAYEAARFLHAPMDIFLVRKLGVPAHEELAMGAIASGGVRVLNDQVIALLKIPERAVLDATTRELHELNRREQAYRGSVPPLDLRGRALILIDDGLATGASMRAAVLAVREHHPARVVVAVPVGSDQSCRELELLADAVVCLSRPRDFSAVGAYYQDFRQTTDEEVTHLLEASRLQEQHS